MATDHLSPNPHPVTRAIQVPQIPDSAPRTSANTESSLIASQSPDITPTTFLTFHTAEDSGSHGRRGASESPPSAMDRDVTVILT